MPKSSAATETSFTVCIAGRPNVGKSTLFNKLTRTRDALVDNRPGVTRDRIFGLADIEGIPTLLIDTGGFEPVAEDAISSQVREQVILAIEEADVICFVVDGRAGVMPLDDEIAERLRKSGKPTVVAVNKLDTPKSETGSADFYGLGFEKVIPVSAEHSIGLGDLSEALAAGRKPPAESLEEPEPDGEPAITVAVVGCPNVGKSSLVNRILGEKRMMVSDVPGTTRDSVDSRVKWHGRELVFIDTAGIRKKSRISRKLEKYSVVMAIKGISRAKTALLVIDAVKGITDQDARIAGIIYEHGRACVVLVNKWDLVEKDSGSTEVFKKGIHEKLGFLSFAPVLFVSAETGQRLGRIMDTIDAVMKEYRKRLPTGPLNRSLKAWIQRKQPPISKGHRPKIYYASQIRSSPPRINFVVSRPPSVTDEYKRYLVNRLRDEYGFEGSPIICRFQPRKGRQ
ncbi:MAG: GTPase Der [bacterium]|nr:MAG: GTPase Der [bacterium]